ncbi:serine/threonine kinase-like domain-containing protein STKLD1 isoform X1 [Littorina saxatilis]|uniref:serine/threonine kinase-like domain-containing protein STKLD1 isoform X1 n=1 Tax=Littorina saxatilis TaxID=31220 RepID=UPI0038B51687
MENYKLQERLGKGGQGSVYLVENKEENKKYVLKKVECFDESEANKAFHEALALQKLDHPYVCGYKEFFVMWDKEESSMFVCIVMDYYSKGDLRSVIKQHQDQNIPIPQETVKKYLGEILEGLVYVHRQGIIHRDLKPSNLFVKDDDTLCLGDFGVSTVMGDMRTCPRNTVGTAVYMAPEVMDQAYDERSDVWSLGCVLLEMTSTAIFTQQQLAAKLMDIKKDPYILEEVFEDIAKNFSDDWIKTIRTLLKVKHQTRPTTEALLKMSFVMDCVEASDSSLLDKRKRQAQTINRKRPLAEGQDNPEHIIQYIADTIDHETCVKEGLQALRRLLDSTTALAGGETTPHAPVVLDQASKNLITLAMWDNMGNKDLQIAGCAVLTTLIVNEGDGFAQAEANDVLFTPEALSVVGKVMKEHRGSSDVQLMAAGLILALSANNQASDALGQLGAVQDILAAMRGDPRHVHLQATCCNALWGLTILESNCKTAAEENAIREVCLALQNHVDCAEVAEAAAAAMVSLCLDDSSFEVVNRMDGVGHLLKAMENHIKNAKVVKNICLVLTTLVEPNEECAYRVLTSDKPDDASTPGIPIIIKAYELHRDNAEVVEAIVNLIMELCEYDGVRLDLLSYGVPTQLYEMRAKYHRNKDIMGPCEQALDKLGAGKAMAPRRTGETPK